MKVSVCIATYNGERFIIPQILSILSQLSSEDEIIVSDDNSTDDTISIIKKIGDERIKIFQNDENNSGVARNFENALKRATGGYIFLCDQDDIWLEDKIKIITRELEKYDCVLHNAKLIDSLGNYIEDDLFSIYKTRTGYIRNLARNTYVGCCMAFKKDMLKYILPIPDRITMHDMWIALVSEKKGKTKLITENLILYRRHDNNASTTSDKSKYSRYFQLKYRLIMLYYTILR